MKRRFRRHQKCHNCKHAYFRHLRKRYDKQQPCAAYGFAACRCPGFAYWGRM